MEKENKREGGVMVWGVIELLAVMGLLQLERERDVGGKEYTIDETVYFIAD